MFRYLHLIVDLGVRARFQLIVEYGAEGDGCLAGSTCSRGCGERNELDVVHAAEHCGVLSLHDAL